jgi:hypothetical protein
VSTTIEESIANADRCFAIQVRPIAGIHATIDEKLIEAACVSVLIHRANDEAYATVYIILA